MRNNMGKEKKDAPGKCPNCGEVLGYEDTIDDNIDTIGDNTFAEVSCDKCGYHGKEHYKIIFDRHEKL